MGGRREERQEGQREERQERWRERKREKVYKDHANVKV